MSDSFRPSVTYSAAKLTPILPVTTPAASLPPHALQPSSSNSRPVTVVGTSSSSSIPTVTRISFTPAAAAAAAAAAGTNRRRIMSGHQQQQQQPAHVATLSPAVPSSGAIPAGAIKVEPRLNGFGVPDVVSQQQVPAAAAHLNLSQAGGVTVQAEDSKDWQQAEQQCCLIESGRRCLKPAGNASYSKRIQKTVTQKKLKLYMDNRANHIYICDYHKNMIQSLRAKRKRKDSEDDSGETDSEHPEVDLYQLQVNTLRRYKKHFKVSSRPGLNKAQLADSLMHHFKTIPVAEKEALTFFIYMIKTNKSKLDRDRRDEND